jgi:hypothetical protein
VEPCDPGSRGAVRQRWPMVSWCGLGFAVDVDVRTKHGRFIQLTPPGSGCSVQISTGYAGDTMTPGSLRGLVLVVPDIRVAHAELDRAGVQTGGVVVSGDGVDFRPARDDDDLDDVGFVHCTDPDGNGWTVQQISARGLPSQPTPRPA